MRLVRFVFCEAEEIRNGGRRESVDFFNGIYVLLLLFCLVFILKGYICNVIKLIDYDYSLSTDIFSVDLCEGTHAGFFMRQTAGRAIIVCPPSTDFRSRARQLMLGRAIVEAMRKEVKRVVVPRLQMFSEQTGITYRRSFVRQSHTNWGSCSSNGNINLSVFLMALPSRYIDYVLLHELCHRREMNHSPKFWALLDSFTGGEAKRLRKEMNDYARGIAPLLIPLVEATR